MGTTDEHGIPVGHGSTPEFSPETEIRLYPTGMDKEQLKSLINTGQLNIENINPEIKGEGIIHRKHFLLYRPTKKISEQEFNSFLEKILNHVSHILNLSGITSYTYDVFSRGYWKGSTRETISHNPPYHGNGSIT